MALKDNGEYTIRLLHQSAFETLNFGEVTITVDRLMRVRSRSSSAEKQEPLVIQIAKTKSARVDPALFLALAEARQKSARRN